jgi:hypothetical protein
VSPPPPDPAWSTTLQRCEKCGVANELTRTFCLNCGAKLNPAGASRVGAASVVPAYASRDPGSGRRNIAFVLGGALLVLLAVAIGFVAFGGLGPAAPHGSASPPASFIAGAGSASPVGTASPGSSSAASAAAPSTVQPQTAAPESLPPQTEPPATDVPATAPPAGGFVCAASTFSATQPGGWRIVQATWNRRAQADVLSLQMQTTSSGSTASVDANVVPPDQVQPTYGVPGPASGDVAVVLAFNDAVTGGTFGSPVGFRALQEFQVYRKGGREILVMGVNGSGCYGISSAAWTSGSGGAPSLVVAIQR